MSYSPNVAVPPVHKMVVQTCPAFRGESTTFIRLYVGMTEDKFHRSSGADRENCKELFSIDQMQDGRYKLVHVTSTLSLRDRSKRVRGVTTTSDKIDRILQKFVDSLQVSV